MTAVEERPYDGQPTFTYRPEDGSDPIVFPKSSVLWEEVDGVKPIKFLWKIRKLNNTYQTFEFMDRAKVPDDIQERVLDLSDEERGKFFERWFDEMSQPPESELPPE